jgi:hypothetical protein
LYIKYFRERTPLTSCPFVHELSQYVKYKDTVPEDLTSVLQQDNVFKTFYMKIIDGDLRAAYDFRHGTTTDKSEKVKGKHVIIVGAGISGLAAAYELEKVGYTIIIYIYFISRRPFFKTQRRSCSCQCKSTLY